MLTTLLLTVTILAICMALLSVKIWGTKNGTFPNTHVGGNKVLGKKGIHCAKTQDKEEVMRKNLYDRMNEKKNK